MIGRTKFVRKKIKEARKEVRTMSKTSKELKKNKVRGRTAQILCMKQRYEELADYIDDLLSIEDIVFAARKRHLQFADGMMYNRLQEQYPKEFKIILKELDPEEYKACYTKRGKKESMKTQFCKKCGRIVKRGELHGNPAAINRVFGEYTE